MPTRRFQFSLKELLAVTVASGALMVAGSYRLASAEVLSDATGVIIAALVIFLLSWFAFGYIWIDWTAWRWRATVLVFVTLVCGIFVGKHELLQRRYASNYDRNRRPYRFLWTFCTAEDIYRRTDYNRDGFLEYAQTLQDLYETKRGAADIELIEPQYYLAAVAAANGVSPPNGYFYKVLTAQGPNAPGGSRSYMKEGRMVLGYALVGYPAVWEPDMLTYIVSQHGTRYSRDLGPNTQKIAEKMDAFDPGPGWNVEE